MSDIVEAALGVIADSLIDTAKLLPFLFAVFCAIEFFEHKAGDKLSEKLQKAGNSPLGVLGGALLGCFPQCGFSAAASNLYAGEMITMGTLLAVFIATSDEALPVLISSGGAAAAVFPLIAAKIVIAVIAGFVTDAAMKVLGHRRRERAMEEFCHDCGCGSHGVWYSGLKHTLETALFILLVNLLLGALIAFMGEEALSEALDSMGRFQPVIAGLIGMIPNCAASVVLTELYIKGAISFGSAAAGLVSGAGVGLAVLFKANKDMKENFIILGILYLTGVISGIILDLL